MSIVLQLRDGSAERVLRGQDHFWAVMRQAHANGEAFSVSSIDRASNADKGDIRKFIRALLAAGFIEPAGETPHDRGGSAEKLYRVSRLQSATPVMGTSGEGRQGRAQQHMWNVMRRQRGGWTASTLAADASTDDVLVGRATALAYSKRLQDAGMLIIVERGGPRHERRWRLKGSADTGPRPPMILRSRLVYDQNTAKVVGPIEGEEALP